MAATFDFLIAIAIGVLVGLAELASRYRDAPEDALRTWASILYTALNAAASGMTLALIRGFGWTFGATGGAVPWIQVLVAGVGSMALFRTSLFMVRAGDQDVGVGPGSFLQIFRDMADREMDRLRAQSRGLRVGQLMDAIDYRKAAEGLIPYCLALTQNVPDEEQQKLLHAVELLDAEQMDEAVKVRILGLHLLNVVGPDVLTAAVQALRAELQAQAA